MEQDLNTTANDEFEIKDFFQIEFKGQNVENSVEFKKWYEGAKIYIEKENKRRKDDYVRELNYRDTCILTIQFCENCLSYTLCSLCSRFSFVKCNKCHEEICIGCSRRRRKGDGDYGKENTCLKGYLKALYLRIINRRSGLLINSQIFDVLHVIICLFFTPLLIGFMSNIIGLLVHRKKKIKENVDDNWKDIKNCYIIIYSFFQRNFNVSLYHIIFSFYVYFIIT